MLKELLHPLSKDDFFSKYWSRQHVYLTGEENRFCWLFSWEVLSTTLDLHWHDLKYPALRLVRDGKMVPERHYSEPATTAREGTVSRPSSEKVQEICRRGATLVLNAVDKRCRPVGEFALRLATELGHRIQVNAYYSQPNIQGFDLHYDPHEIFVLQIAGRKRWRVAAESSKFPLPSEHYTEAAPPAGPHQSYLMTPGDILYLPRGVWHAAIADQGPSLHLTVGIYCAKRLDFALWLIGRLRTEEDLRLNLHSEMGSEGYREEGSEATIEAMADYLESIRGKEKELLLEYYRECDIEGRMAHELFKLPLAPE